MKICGVSVTWPVLTGLISLELNRMIKALRSVAHQAIEDSKTKREMTEEQARKRYEDLMREKLNEDQLDLFPKK